MYLFGRLLTGLRIPKTHITDLAAEGMKLIVARQTVSRNLKFRRFSIYLAAIAFFCCLTNTVRAEPGVFEDRIVFGQSAAFEGPAASLGTDIRNGILAAFDEVNRTGGVNGRKLELISYNDGYEPELAIDNTRRLIEQDQVFALIGEVGTPTSRAVQPIAREYRAPFIGAFTGAAFLRDPGLTNVINIRASYDQETEELVDFLVKDRGIKRIAILYQDDTFGSAGLSGVVAALNRRGLELVADGTYMRNTVAVKRAALAIRKAQPDAVIIIGAYKPAAEFIRIARSIGVDALFLTVSFVGSNALASDLGKEGSGVIVSQVVPLFHDTSVSVVASFHDAMAKLSETSGRDLLIDGLGFVSLEGYITGRLVVEVLRDLGDDLTRETFIGLFEELKGYEIDGFSLQYGPGDNQGSNNVFLTVINDDGKFETIKRQAADQ
ncbi:ABC transporter substrate-binding protein [Flavimaribacter sediminis]|nr:ABC transporter substrate-binding protein [Flavimaribacter sediminis]